MFLGHGRCKKPKKNKYQAVVAATKQDAEGFVFPEIEQARMHNVFWVNRETNWRFAGVKSLEDMCLGVIEGYTYSPEIQPYIEKNKKSVKVQSMHGETPLVQNIRKLVIGRVTTVLEDESVFKYTAAQMKLAEKFKPAGDDGTNPELNNLYIAFSPTNPRSNEYAKLLSDGMKKIREEGVLKIILSKYGLSDWR